MAYQYLQVRLYLYEERAKQRYPKQKADLIRKFAVKRLEMPKVCLLAVPSGTASKYLEVPIEISLDITLLN